MHCQACDCLLTDSQSVRKDPNTGDYLDLCDSCAGLMDEVEDTSDLNLILFEKEKENAETSDC